MILGFSNLIGLIESENEFKYLGGAIRWCDENHHLAWSNALDRFDKSLSVAIERKDFALAKTEGDFYKATILDLLTKYKRFKNMDDTTSFLKSITTL